MKSTQTITTMALAAIISILVAVTSAILVHDALDVYEASLRHADDVSSLTTVRPQPVPGTYEEALTQVRSVVETTTVQIATTSTDTANAFQWFDDAQTTEGMLVTSDGWLLTHRAALPALRADGIEVWMDGERFAVREVIEDDVSDLVLLQTDIRNGQVAAFGDSAGVLSGDLLFAVLGKEQVAVTAAVTVDSLVGGLTGPAEQLDTTWLLDETFEEGTMIVNSAGELVAMVMEKEVLPLHHAARFVQATLRGEVVRYAGVGAVVADVDRLLNVDADAVQGQSEGALVQSLVFGAVDGVEVGDVILSVNGARIQNNTTLAELLLGFDPGDDVVMVVVRDGQQMDVPVTFVDRADLVY